MELESNLKLKQKSLTIKRLLGIAVLEAGIDIFWSL
jgi:hypothetical protein